MRLPIAALTLAALTGLGCGPQPEHARSWRNPQQAPAPSASHPTAFTGTAQPDEDPTAALKARTYVTVASGDLVHAGTTAGVVSWSFEQPSRPHELATLVLPGSVSGLTLFGPSQSMLAVSTGPTGLVLVDTSNVARGRLHKLSDAPWRASDRAGCHAAWNLRMFAERRAFVACGTGGIAEVDLSDTARPRVTRSLPVDGYVRDLAVLDAKAGISAGKASSRKLIAAAGHGGVVVAEFPEAGQPKLLAHLPSSGARALEVRAGLAYLADGAGGLRTVDVHDPAHPVELGRFDPHTVDLARGLAVRETTVFLCLGDSGLMSVDVSNPASPRKLAALDPLRAINRATLRDAWLFASNDAAGILLLDVSHPDSLKTLFPSP